MLSVTPIYAALLAILYVVLSAKVISQRRSDKISYGDGGNTAMLKVMRTHSNFVEYTPFALLLIAMVELQGAGGLLLNLLGIALIQDGQPQEAIPHLKRVLEANPANASVHNNLASAYAQVGDRQRAADHFSETIKLAPGHLGATLNLGELNLEGGELDVAEAYFNRALQIQPGNPTATARLEQIRQRREN